MGKKTKPEKPSDAPEKKNDVEKSERGEQMKKDYYYDDAHGYEIYNPEINDEENDENQ